MFLPTSMRLRRSRPICHRPTRLQLYLEQLEQRTVPTTIDWLNNASGNWDLGANWVGGNVPGSGDDAVINTASPATITIQTGDLESVHSLTLAGSDTLAFAGGSLAIAGNSTLSGGLTMTGGSLTVSGSGVTVLANGPTTVSAASLIAEGGATFSLPGLTSYAGLVNGSSTLGATGTGSVLSLANLASLSSDTTNFNSLVQVQVLAGGSVQMPSLTQISGGAVTLKSDGSGSVLNVSALASFSGISGGQGTLSSLAATNGGAVQDGDLTSLNDVQLPLDGTSSISVSQIATFTGGTLTLSSNTVTLSSLTNGNGSSFEASGGATLIIPGVTSYAGSAVNFSSTTLEATGTGSVLTMTNLASLSGDTTSFSTLVQVQALAGGNVQLPSLTQISGGAVALESDGSGSILNVSSLTSFSGILGGHASVSSLQASNGGAVQDGSLNSLINVNLPLDGTSSISVSQIVTFSGGTLTLSSNTVTLSSLSDANGASFEVSGGATLNLPDVSSYGGSSINFSSTTLEATGTGSKLTLASLDSISGDTTSFSTLVQVQALAGGNVQLPSLTQISGGAVAVESDGNGSILNVSSLTSFTGILGGHASESSLQASHGGTVQDGSLNTLINVNLPLDGTSSISVGQINAFIGGTLTLSSNTVTLGSLTAATGASFEASGGATLNLPDVSSYGGSSINFNSSTLEATGTGSVLSLPNLTSLSGDTTSFSTLVQVEALAGGNVQLPSLTQISGGAVALVSDGSGSVLNVSSLTSFSGISGGHATVSTLQATNGGTILDANLPGLTNVNLTLDGSGSISLNQFTAYTGGTLTFIGSGSVTLDGLTNIDGSAFNVNGNATLNLAPGLSYVGTNGFRLGNGGSLELGATQVTMPSAGTGATINIPQLPQGVTLTLTSTGTFTGTVFNVGQSDTINVASGSFIGNTSFNLGAGTIVDLTDGQTLTYSGIINGSGGGTLQLSGGTLTIGAGGLTLNLPGSMFTWTGSSFIDSNLGDLTNLGTINLTGANVKYFLNDGTLDNFGTIVQTGLGDLELGSAGHNFSPTELLNEPGASYLIEGNSGVTEGFFGQTAIVNEGRIAKTAGSGTATLLVGGPISNGGVIEADSGTLALNALSVTQVSGTTLLAGTWNALNGATLQFPNSTSITSNAGNITLSGAGATIAGIAGLDANSGSFAITNSASFTTTSNFSNSGSVTVGAGSTLTVAGNFTQTSAGALTVQIGGSNVIGKVAVTATAALAGALHVGLANNFMPTAGQQFPIMTFASASGNFNTVTGLTPLFTEAIQPTDLVLAVPSTAVDLSLASVSAPTAATGGQPITVSWQVNDTSSQAATGSWQDSVYLSSTSGVTASSILLGTVQHNGGLSAGGHYNASLTVGLPAVPPGFYNVIVVTDSLNQVPDPNRANNALSAGTGLLNVTLPSLTLGTPLNDSFTAANQDHYYQVTVPVGGSLFVSLASNAASGATALYISQGTQPTPFNYQYASTIANQPNQSVTVPQVLAAGTYYILAHSVSGAAATAGYSLTVTQTAALAVTGIGAFSGGNAGNVTLEIDGTNLTPTTTASLKLGGTTINDSAIDFVSASQIYATFPLAGAAVGNYSVSVHQGAQTATAPASFQVVAASAASVNAMLIAPQFIRAGRTGTILVTYTNETQNDLTAPLLEVASTNAAVSFSTPDDPNDYVQSAQILAVAPNGPAGILRPGQSGQLTLTLLSNDTINNDKIPVQISQIEAGQSLNLAAQQASLKPSSFSTAAWNTIFGNLMATVGSTTDSYNAALAQAATYLSDLGETTSEVGDVSRLWSFLVSQADAVFPTTSLTSDTDASLATPGNLSLALDRTFVSSIAGRYQPGLFGLGWTTSWQISISVDSSGNATISNGGAFGFFSLQANGAYLDTDGVYGTLTKSGGVFTFTETSGTQYVFLPDGQLNYEQDTNGNRITLGYNVQNQLITLTYANPADSSEPAEQLTLTYNGQGLVSQVGDGTGAVWTYVYDATGHLLSVTDPGNLTTSYTYDTGSNGETANALLSITNPDGSQQNFAYDAATGRLVSASLNGGADLIAYTYLGEAEVAATNQAGQQATFWFNDSGQTARVEDPLGGLTSYSYDTNGNPIRFTDESGATYQLTYDSNGNLTQLVNPLGQTDQLTYGPLDTLTSFTDADSNTTEYTYNSAGNALSIIYPDGTKQAFSYDPLGNLTDTIEQNGDPIDYQYNGQGLITQEAFADGSSESFTYDAHGNLLTAKTFDTSDTLSGTTTLTYNPANELTAIVYPNGQFLDFTYNSKGQRTQSIDQDSFTVNYSYDSLGRLSELTDGSANLIVQYSYNNVNQLVQKLNGNGTSTTYAYDANGNLTSEVNFAGGTTVNSSFTYTYNALNEQTSVTDNSGNTTTYRYDATGQLIGVGLPSGQTITYVYNAAGDRTEVLNNGTPSTYASNVDNEITQVGSTVYAYDSNGNLHTVTDASGTTTYTYNDLNQLVSVTNPDGSVQTFQYSPLGFLVGASATNGATTSQTDYLVDPTGLSDIVASYNGSGSLIANYTQGLGLVSQTGPSGTGYYDFDALGNTVGITGAGGAYVNQYSYLPFGETSTISAALPNPFTFVGQLGVLQIGTNLFSMRAREYTPLTGQFLSNDPIGLVGGDTNVRRYVNNAPNSAVDPSGLGLIFESPYPPDPNQPTGTYPIPPGTTINIPGLGPVKITKPGSTIDYPKPPGGGKPGGGGGKPGGGGGVPGGGGGKPTSGKPTGGGGKPSGGPEPGGPVGMLPSQSTPPTSGFGGGGAGSSLPEGVFQLPDGQININNLKSTDPNALVGPAGFGTPNFIQPASAWSYTIDFENDGSVAAQDVTVTEQMDPNLDWSTFQLGSFSFGSVDVTVPAGLTQYQTTVNSQNTDGSPLKIDVDLDFNEQTGLLTATFVSLDPTTGAAPIGVFDGFLPPDNSSQIGEGSVQYTIQPKANLTTGTAINQRAAVVFDTNAPITTATFTNTIDNRPPTSSVTALPVREGSTSFTVNWSGQDDANGSGIATYNIFVSDNGGSFTPFLSNTTLTSATFTGVNGHTYGFYSVATDNVGHVQATPSGAQATTTVALPAMIAATSGGGQSVAVNTAFASPLVATVTDANGNPVSGVTVIFGGPAGDANVIFPDGDTAVTDSEGDASVAVTANSVAGSYTVSASVGGVAMSASFMLNNTSTAVPVFTSLDSATFLTTVRGTFDVGVTGTNTVSESGALPAGVTFVSMQIGSSTFENQLQGAPAPGTNGVYNITFFANDGAGSASQAFTLTVNSPVDELAAYRASTGSWSLDSDTTPGFNSATDQVFYSFSPPNVVGVAGDWTGSGVTEIGFFNKGVWGLDLQDNGVLTASDTFTFGQAGDQPVVGDWTGDGISNIGVFRAAPDGITGEFILDTNGDHIMDAGDTTFTFGLATDRIVIGDWNGAGKDEVGVFRDAKSFIPGDAGDAVFSLDTNGDHTFDGGDQVFVFGLITDGLIVGDWNGGPKTLIGVYRDGSTAPVGNPLYAPGTGLFSLDSNGDGNFDAGDAVFLYGLSSDQFVAGHWAQTPPIQPEGTPQAQFAANGPGPGNVSPLTAAQLQPVLQEAIAAWIADGASATVLESAQVRISTLGDNLVGLTNGNQITLDSTADGWGWNTDPSNAAFTTLGPDGFQATPGSAAARKIDLLTVVEHELGHELGLGDVMPQSDPSDLMAATLAVGVRRQPTVADLDRLFTLLANA